MSKTLSDPRVQAIQTVSQRTPRPFLPPRDEKGNALKVSEYFGMNTFNVHRMREKLPKDVFTKLQATIESGKKLDIAIANSVAHAVKEWALEQGVTHFCHWFQPQTGSTAEKHDAFLSIDDHKLPVERFSGYQLIQSEPDASSFPSGGMRTTFEARGYTAWDPSSPIFIMESTNCKTLCIPSVFISYRGHALDEKTGLLRSMEALSRNACELLQTIGVQGVRRVVPTLGCEQEYFLIDRAFVQHRPDLLMSGRTLLGGQPPKGQQLEDHYFGSIPSRVLAFMTELESELFKLGVPIKTRHNEVAPSQFETAPIFEEANVAVDHNQLTMEILRKVARRHQFEALLHEKPFSGVNGSGKHCNWSMMIQARDSDIDGENLLEPGKNPQENIRFLLFLAAVLKGVHNHAGLLRAGIASHGNDHRLGANEAPPAIISVFLGEQLSAILDKIESGMTTSQNTEAAVLQLGVAQLPEVLKDNTDRNRTSPFAFTGNKFEFRAVGSSASPAFPITVLNTAVAEAIAELNSVLKAKLQATRSLDTAILESIRETVTSTKVIRFEGNNYSDDWVKEADKRGLLNLRKTPEALAQMDQAKAKSTFSKLEVFSEAELESRYHVRLERYIKSLQIEADTLKTLVETYVLPAAFSYHSDLSQGVSSAKNAGVSAPQTESLARLGDLLNSLQVAKKSFDSAIQKAEAAGADSKKAVLYSSEVAGCIEEVRSVCDQIEGTIADQYWPLPKYREMLFLS